MKQTFDTDNYLYGVLKASSQLVYAISGDIYVMNERPDGSSNEDIVINTITLTQDSTPQSGVSNINIHVADIDVKIKGQNQKKADRKRLQELTTMVIVVLTLAKINGLSFQITNQNTISESELSQHYVNLRIEWNIH